LATLSTPRGSLSDFQNFYEASWGAFKSKTYPIPGNHEYETSGASGYFQYFGTGSAVPIASPGYYSLNLGDWHIAFLNTNCTQIDCTAEKTWLKSDLNADTHLCDMVVYHATNLKWPRLKAEKYHVDIGLAASRHVYERWPPENGLTRFTVGTGGFSLGKLSSGFDAGVPNVRRDHDDVERHRIRLGVPRYEQQRPRPRDAFLRVILVYTLLCLVPQIGSGGAARP
jgi:hypothetical protein